MKKALVIFGSASDRRVYGPLLQGMEDAGIPFEFRPCSAHKSPTYLEEILRDVDKRFSLIIAGAGLAAHLPGVIASKTILPVMGVPVDAALGGIDALLSIMQMPPGVPVLSVGVNKHREAVRNAALMLKGCSKLAIIRHGMGSEKQQEETARLCSQFRVESELCGSFQRDAININLVGDDSHTALPDDCLVINVPVMEKPTTADVITLLRYSQKGLWVGTNRVENAVIAAVQAMNLERQYSKALHDFKRGLEKRMRNHAASH